MTSRSAAISNQLRIDFPSINCGKPRKLRYGIAINDSDYFTGRCDATGRPVCPAMAAWNSMLQRSYCEKWHARHPSYIGVSVCDEWHSFMAFRAWWIENHVDGWHLDKDLLNARPKQYSPENCIYIPRWLNLFTCDCLSGRGDQPIGVDLQRSGYRARCSDPTNNSSSHLGYFSSPESAYAAWHKRKIELALSLKPEMDAIDARIYHSVVLMINDPR